VNFRREKCTVLIFSISISAKLTWWQKRTALKTIYAGGIIPLVLYGAPVLKVILDIKCYKSNLIKGKRIIIIRIAKAYRAVSNEALYVITALIPINIKIEEAAKYYESVKEKGHLLDREMEVKYWSHPANKVGITDDQQGSRNKIYVYTASSKSEHGVGSRIVIFKERN